MSDHIKIETTDRVTRLTISRTDKKNAITQDMYGTMADTIIAYGKDPEVRALVITGEGDMFTAGNDLQDFSTGGASDDEVPAVSRFLFALRDCPKPILAAVNGPAIGVGLTMLLHCDLVYAGQGASFNAPFVKLGLVPEAASSLLLPAAVGMAVANDILLAGRTLDAEEALRSGLIARIFPDAQLQEAVSDIALHIARSAPNALKQSKLLIRHQRQQVTDQMHAEAKLFIEQLQSPDFRESVAAMIEKRAPVYG